MRDLLTLRPLKRRCRRAEVGLTAANATQGADHATTQRGDPPVHYPLRRRGDTHCRGASYRPTRLSAISRAPDRARFYSGETVTLYLRVTGPDQNATYEVADYAQARSCTGEAPIGGGRSTTFTFPRLGNGIYYLRVSFPTGRPSATPSVSSPGRMRSPGRPSLWGYQYGARREPLRDAGACGYPVRAI